MNLKGSRLRHGHCRGETDTPEYRTWRAMMHRCHMKTDQKYPMYGARGIIVCVRWHLFESFLADMGPRPPGHTIDRFPDQNGNYEPANCRWATPKQQTRNSRAVRLIEIDGKQISLIEVAEKYGLNYGTFKSRILRGWPVERALSKEDGRLILRSVAP